jgi:hypothetical protein
MQKLSGFRFWLRCSGFAASRAWLHFNFLLAVVAVISGACVVKFIAEYLKQRGIDMNYWLLIIPVLLLGGLFAFHLFRAPYEIYKELYKTYEGDMATTDAAIKKLTDEVQKIKDARPELELLPSLADTDTEGKYFCRVAVRNKSKTATANLVKVELLRIDPSPELQAYSFWAGDVPYPFSLKPSDPEGRTIHPACTSKFDVFSVVRITETKASKLIAYNMTVDFVGRPRFLTENHDLPNFKMCGFRPEINSAKKPALEYKEYSIKIRASAEHVPAIEKTFSLFFCLDLSQDAVQIFDGDNTPKHYESFADLPTDLCKRLLRSKTSLLKELERIKNENQ